MQLGPKRSGVGVIVVNAGTPNNGLRAPLYFTANPALPASNAPASPVVPTASEEQHNDENDQQNLQHVLLLPQKQAHKTGGALVTRVSVIEGAFTTHASVCIGRTPGTSSPSMSEASVGATTPVRRRKPAVSLVAFVAVLVFLGLLACIECSQILSLACFRVFLSGVEAIFA